MANRELQWETAFVRRVTKQGLIATIGFDVWLFSPHRGIHVPSGGCGECQRGVLELTRIATSIAPASDRGCIYQVLPPDRASRPIDSEWSGGEVCMVLRGASRDLPLGVAQLGSLRRIGEALHRLGATRRA